MAQARPNRDYLKGEPVERRRVFTVLLAAAAGLLLLGTSCKLANKAPAVPTLTGPTTGVAGVAISFTATATDPESDSLQLQFDWGDNSTPAWTAFVASGDTITATNTYADSGTFIIKARAKDKSGKESDWSAGQTLSLIAAAPAFPDSMVSETRMPWDCWRSGMSPDGSLICVGPSSAPAESLILYRTSDRAVISHIRTGPTVGAVAFTSDNGLLFVSCNSSQRVLRVDLSQGRVTDSSAAVRAPQALLVSPDNSRLYASITSQKKVLVLRTDDLAQLDSMVFDSYVEGIALNRAGTMLYVCTSNGIGIMDAAACSVVVSNRTFGLAYKPVLSPDGRLLYVQSVADSGLVALAAADLSVVTRANLHATSLGLMSISPDGAYVYLEMGIGLYAIDTRTMAPVDSIALQMGGDIMPHPNGDSLYCHGGRKFYVLGKSH
jgi:DNA-binding beta-propeller fold protein YncE